MILRSVVAVVRSAEVNWTGLSSLDTWFPHFWEPGKVFSLSQGHTTVCASVRLMAMIPSPVRHCWLALCVSLSITCFRWMRRAPELSVLMLLLIRSLMPWAVIYATKSSRSIMLKTMATTGTLLMGLLILTSTIMPVFAKTSTPVASYAVQLAWPYLKM